VLGHGERELVKVAAGDRPVVAVGHSKRLRV
jgi:hypothetical protein